MVVVVLIEIASQQRWQWPCSAGCLSEGLASYPCFCYSSSQSLFQMFPYLYSVLNHNVLGGQGFYLSLLCFYHGFAATSFYCPAKCSVPPVLKRVRQGREQRGAWVGETDRDRPEWKPLAVLGELGCHGCLSGIWLDQAFIPRVQREGAEPLEESDLWSGEQETADEAGGEDGIRGEKLGGVGDSAGKARQRNCWDPDPEGMRLTLRDSSGQKHTDTHSFT